MLNQASCFGRSVLLMLALSCTASALADEIRPGVFRTPDARFANLPGYAFAPNYVEVNGLRMHYVDEGEGDTVLMLHGEPSWSFLYRKMVQPVVDGGNRVIAPDLIGFGRSDKPANVDTHSYAYHVDNITRFIEELDLEDITLVCQDWGSLIGLRVAAENPERFARIVVANGALPTGEQEMPLAFSMWRASVQQMNEQGDMPVGNIVGRGKSADIIAAYDAPFPDARYKAGALALPLLVPISLDDPASAANQAAWEVYESWTKPMLTAYSDGDPVTRGWDQIFQARVPGTQGQNHVILEGGGHFLQEDIGERLAEVIVEFIDANPL